jgi:CO dehydrogenase maturation factor
MAEKKVIAACGKGGVGKTAFSAALTRLLFDDGKNTLVIDADPAMGLSSLLGVWKQIKTIGGVRDELIQKAKQEGSNAQAEIADMFDYLVMECLFEAPQFNLLAMGRSRFKGCFCPVNRILRDAIESMAANFDVVIVDAEAGVEQINRDVIRRVDTLVLLMDSSLRSVQTGGIIKEMTQALNMGCEVGGVINRAGGNWEVIREALQKERIPFWGVIPEDEILRKIDTEGKTIFDLPPTAPLLVAVEKIIEKIGC